MSEANVQSVVEFWRDAGPARWWAKNAAFDDDFRRRFLALHERAAKGELESCLKDASGALGVLLLLDQFPRNCFRGSPRMFATDERACRYADVAVSAKLDREVDEKLRVFFYTPFMHAEDLEAQERSIALCTPIGNGSFAVLHRDIIRRFGRFPHRNAILGRTTTVAEQGFLDGGGFAG